MPDSYRFNELHIFIPGIPSNTNKSGHMGSGKWQTVGERAKFRKLACEVATAEAEEAGWIPTTGVTTIFAYHVSPVRRRRDPLGLAERLKSIMDGLVDAEVIPDDDEKHIIIQLMPSVIEPEAGIKLILRVPIDDE